MKLRLTMIASPPSQGGDTQRHLATGKLTLGRGSDNDWVLRDEERVLSKNHCVVEFKSGVYVVIDSSTNGVFHNESLEPLGRGNSAVLADGDRLRFGAFVVKAQFVADDPLPEAADPFLAVLRATDDRASSAIPDDPFDDGDPFAAGPKTPVAFTPIPDDDDDDDHDHDHGGGAGFLLPPRPKLDPAAAEAAWRRDNPEWAPVADRDDVGGHEQAWSGSAVAGGAIPDDWDDESGADLPESSSPPCFASYFPEPPPAPPQPLPVAAIPDDWAEAPAPAPVSPFAPSPFLADDGAVERLARQAQAQAQGLDVALPAGEDAEAAVSLHMRALLAAARRVMADAGLPVEYLENAYRRALDEGTL
jgi:type VI secretion system FHA domain protein